VKAYIRIIGVIATLILTAAPALADLTWNVGDPITYTYSNGVYAVGYGYGGLFKITDTATGAVADSFCIELNEHIYNGDLVAGISGKAVKGGVGGGNPDPIRPATDWLYAQYANGVGGFSNLQALQVAFWRLEDEIADGVYATIITDSVLRGIADSYVTLALAHDTGKYGTQVLNLKGTDGSDHQSQLIYQPVPIPATIWLLGSCLIALVGIRRRYQK
jgi:hypothetical protein